MAIFEVSSNICKYISMPLATSRHNEFGITAVLNSGPAKKAENV